MIKMGKRRVERERERKERGDKKRGLYKPVQSTNPASVSKERLLATGPKNKFTPPDRGY